MTITLKAIKTVIIFSSFIFFTSCYENRDFDQIPKNAPKEVIEFFQEFYLYAHQYRVDIKWKPLNVEYVDEIIGYRTTYIDRGSLKKDKILIDTTSREYQLGRRGMIFRVFGQYYLNRHHEIDWDTTFYYPIYGDDGNDSGMMPIMLPPSIMTTTRIIPDKGVLQPIWTDYYIPELFMDIEPNVDSLSNVLNR